MRFPFVVRVEKLETGPEMSVVEIAVVVSGPARETGLH